MQETFKLMIGTRGGGGYGQRELPIEGGPGFLSIRSRLERKATLSVSASNEFTVVVSNGMGGGDTTQPSRQSLPSFFLVQCQLQMARSSFRGFIQLGQRTQYGNKP